MFSSAVLLVLVACVAVPTLAFPTAESQTGVKVITVDHLSKLSGLPRGAQLVPLKKTQSSDSLMIYTLGKRTNNDKLLSRFYSDTETYDSDKNVEFKVQYPSAGAEGGKISCVEILVDASSKVGKVYLVSGGLGQSQVEIVVEVKNTTHLRYISQIWE